MSGDRPKLISTPTSFSQGVARTDMKTWGVMGILFLIALAVVFGLNLFHERKPMFGDAPFGSGPPQPERLREIPVVTSRPPPAQPPAH